MQLIVSRKMTYLVLLNLLFPANISRDLYFKEAVSGRYMSNLQLPLTVWGWKSLGLAFTVMKATLQFKSADPILIVPADDRCSIMKTSLFDCIWRAKPLIYLSNGMTHELLCCFHPLYYMSKTIFKQYRSIIYKMKCKKKRKNSLKRLKARKKCQLIN